MKIKLLILVAALAALLTLKANAQTPPPQAVAVGFKNLVFSDDFTNADTFAPSDTPTATSKWYRYGKAVTNDITINPGAGTGATAGATGVMTINNSPDGFNEVIQTVPGNAVGTQRTGTWQHGYFEARMQFSSTVQGNGGSGTGWPSFWMWDTRALSPFAGQLTSECDVLEAWPLGNAGAKDYPINTLHQWDNTASDGGSDIYNTGNNNAMVTPAPPTDNGWHTYGCLWVQTSATDGYIEFYLDNVLVSHRGVVTRFLTGAGTGLSAMETAHLYMIFGTAQGWPLNVDWVHVWQAGTGTGTPQTVTDFPPTLSLSTSQSPYTLPATTSAGLPITYSVTSGPAVVSGHTLTLTGAGTVVVHASQAGNATYAAFSATETITATPLTTKTQTVPSTLGITLPATTSAGLTISYSVVSGPATLTGDVLTFTGAGTVVVKASQAGNATYAACSVAESITFNP